MRLLPSCNRTWRQAVVRDGTRRHSSARESAGASVVLVTAWAVSQAGGGDRSDGSTGPARIVSTEFRVPKQRVEAIAEERRERPGALHEGRRRPNGRRRRHQVGVVGRQLAPG